MFIETVEPHLVDGAAVNRATCACGWQGPTTDCDIETDSEGWEYPDYEYYVCPMCGEPVDY